MVLLLRSGRGAVAAVLLAFAPSMTTTGCCTIEGRGVADAVSEFGPPWCRDQIQAYWSDAYAEEQEAQHKRHSSAYAKARKQAEARSSKGALKSALDKLLASKGNGFVLGGPKSADDVRREAEAQGVVLPDELVELYAWHDGADCDRSPIWEEVCFYSFAEAKTRRQADRELYPGTPSAWWPVFGAPTETLYVVVEEGPSRALPLFRVSLLSPDVPVAFVNVQSLVKTWVRWSDEELTSTEGLDASGLARRESIHREENPGATLVW